MVYIWKGFIIIITSPRSEDGDQGDRFRAGSEGGAEEEASARCLTNVLEIRSTESRIASRGTGSKGTTLTSQGKGARSLISPVEGRNNGTLCATATSICRTTELSIGENVKTTATVCRETTDQWERNKSAYGIKMPLVSNEMDRDWSTAIRNQSGHQHQPK